MRSIQRSTAGVLVILALAAVVFGSLLNAPPLTWDDDTNIFGNPYFQEGLWLPFWEDAYFGLFVPVTSMIWGLLFQLGGGDAWPFRVLNTLVHLANVYLVYRLLVALAKRWDLKPESALFGAGLFALHPLQVHAVAWISGGRDLLSVLFALLAVAAYFRWPGRKGLWLSTAGFALALLSKPGVVTVPLILPLLVMVVDRSRLRASLWHAALWCGLSALSVAQTYYAQSQYLPDVGWEWRPLIMLDTYSFYLQKLFVPYPLSANYARTPELVLANVEQSLVRASIALVVVFGGFYFASRREPKAALAWAWLILLLPVSGVVVFGYQQISTPSDHYQYPAMAVIGALSLLLPKLLHQQQRFLGALAAIVLVVCSGLAMARTKAWRGDEAFFTDMASYAPHAYSTALGMSIVECEDHRDFAAGVRWTEVALAAKPGDILALANQAYCYLHAKEYKKVIELESELAKLDVQDLEDKQPTAFSSFLASLGSALIEEKQYTDGYQLLCDAYRVKPVEPNNVQNLEVATQILRAQGLNPSCEDAEGMEPTESIFDYQIPEEQFSDPGGGEADEPITPSEDRE